MRILVTGAKGFIGKNLIAELRNLKYNDIYEFDIDTRENLLEEYCRDCEFIFHLAGVNRPKNHAEFMEGNFELTSRVLDLLKKYNNKARIVFASSIQAELDNEYGRSKKAGENLIFKHAEHMKSDVYVYRFPNVFGKWCKPNYNSVVATFCYNIANNIPIKINDSNALINLVYIDDLVEELVNALECRGRINLDGFYHVDTKYTLALGKIADLIYTFKDSRNNLSIADMSDDFTRKLYSTYLSYLPKQDFSYPLRMNQDDRGSFTEIIRTKDRGQISINISKPGITKGNHWHKTKTEKFVVVSGKGVVRFRKIDSEEVIEYYVDSSKIEVVDIPVGYTHSITNCGDIDLVTIMWVNEPFDQERPDTYFLEV